MSTLVVAVRSRAPAHPAPRTAVGPSVTVDGSCARCTLARLTAAGSCLAGTFFGCVSASVLASNP